MRAIYDRQRYEEKLKKQGKIRQKKQNQGDVISVTSWNIEKVCKELSLDLLAMSYWLEFISVPEDLRAMGLV